MIELIKKVEDWARVRKLDTADPKAQALKVVEEFTEMVLAFDDFKAMKKISERLDGLDELANTKNEVIDGVGDMYVTLIILCQQLDIDFESIRERTNYPRAVDASMVMFQLAAGVSKGTESAIESSIANTMSTANYIAQHINVEPIGCLQVAYNEIKDRKGMMIESTFVKYDDLSAEQKAVLDNA